MNELDQLTRFRDDTPEMTNRALAQGRLRVMKEIRGRTDRAAARPFRRRVGIVVVAGALGLGLAGSQLLGVTGPGPEARAATVLNAAADAAADAANRTPMPAPRPGQFVYQRIVHVTSGMRQTVETWTSADGTRAGLVRSRGFLGTQTTTIDRYDPAAGLRAAPYTVLAKLPTDPDALLKTLYADPGVREQVRQNKVSADVEVWGLLRGLVESAPPAQKAALFLAAAKIKGITYVAEARDAAGRTGEAVGLDDPRLGNVQLIFDKSSHAFLGERIIGRGSTAAVAFNDAVQQVAVVERAGETPRP